MRRKPKLPKPKFRSGNVVAVRAIGYPVKILGRAFQVTDEQGRFFEWAYNVFKLNNAGADCYPEWGLRLLKGAERRP